MNCKPGDLAFIIANGPVFPENVGKVVRVIGPSTGKHDWRVQSEGGLLKTVGGWKTQANVRDACLRPIRPEPELLPAPPVAVTA